MYGFPYRENFEASLYCPPLPPIYGASGTHLPWIRLFRDYVYIPWVATGRMGNLQSSHRLFLPGYGWRETGNFIIGAFTLVSYLDREHFLLDVLKKKAPAFVSPVTGADCPVRWAISIHRRGAWAIFRSFGRWHHYSEGGFNLPNP